MNPGIDTQYLLRFAVLYLALQGVYYALSDAVLVHAVDVVLARPAAALAAALTDSTVEASAGFITTAHGSLQIIRGCDGMSSILLLAAAIGATARPAITRVVGLLVGACGLHVLNVLRVAVLACLLRATPATFDAVHEFVAPLVTVAMACALYLGWASWAGAQGSLEGRWWRT